MLQWNAYVPAFGAVNVAVFPPSIDTLKLVPSSDVTVCVNGSWFLIVTVAPAFTGFTLANEVPEIVMSAAPPEPDDDDLLLLPHAARPIASRQAEMKMRMRCCMPRIRIRPGDRFSGF